MNIMISTLDAEQDPLYAVFQYHVAFGDGKSDRIHAGSDLVVTHSYPRNGSFVVTVSATDGFRRTCNPKCAQSRSFVRATLPAPAIKRRQKNLLGCRSEAIESPTGLISSLG